MNNESGKVRPEETGIMRIIKRLFAASALSLMVYGTGAVTTVAVETAQANYLKISKSSIGKTQRIRVGLNQSMVVDLPGDAHDILVANPDVADAITRTSRRIYVFGKQVGSTNLFIFDVNGSQLLNLTIEIERDVEGLEANLKKYVPGSDVKVEVVNDNIILTGTVPTPQASARVVQLSRAFITGGEATTNQFNQSFGGTANNGGTVIFDQEERQESQIVNLLRIDGEDQVHLKVTIAEIQRTVVKQLGIDLTATGLTAGSIAAGLSTDNPFTLANQLTSSSASASYTGSNGESIQGILRAIDQAGVLRTLAEPSLTAISGETASFSVGGEYNIPDGKTESDDGVEFTFRNIEYGVSLSFTPVVLGPGRISMRIRTEVSEPTTEGTGYIPRGAVAASPLPGVRRRQAETTVELPSGGSMILAGLLKDDVRQTAAGFPGLRKIPVLGTLFRSREFQRFETELVVIATPYLVRPIARQKLARPDDNFQPTADGAANFLGRLNRVYGKVEGNLPQGRYHGKVGFILK
ncbi:MAG: type II and III secretion system protein family protein [Pseudomonadota bacterium]